MEKCGKFKVTDAVSANMGRKTRKQVQVQKARIFSRNLEIFGMLKAGISNNQIAKEYGLSCTGAKRLRAKWKSSGNSHRTLGSGQKSKTSETSERSDRYIARQSKTGTPTKIHFAGILEA